MRGSARLESGRVTPRLDFLRQVVEALGGRLVVKVEASEDCKARG
jgi:hypothetical protein